MGQEWLNSSPTTDTNALVNAHNNGSVLGNNTNTAKGSKANHMNNSTSKGNANLNHASKGGLVSSSNMLSSISQQNGKNNMNALKGGPNTHSNQQPTKFPMPMKFPMPAGAAAGQGGALAVAPGARLGLPGLAAADGAAGGAFHALPV